MGNNSVSIIFVNFNGGKEPLECLDSIYCLNYPQNKIEVIVVDNNSIDGSDKQIKLKYPQVKLIKNKTNVGFVKAINYGIKKSTGQYVFIGNDDLIFEKNSIRVMIDYFAQHPRTGIIGGKIFFKDHPQQISSAGYLMNKWTGHIYPAPIFGKTKEPNWVQGCAMFVRRTLFNQIGLLDEDFSLIYFEDFDLCLRAKKNGWKVVYLPTAIFWHGQSTTMDKQKSNKYFQWYKNKIRFMIKHLPFMNIVCIISLQCFIMTPFRALILRDSRFLPFLQGLWWNLKNLNQTYQQREQLS